MTLPRSHSVPRPRPQVDPDPALTRRALETAWSYLHMARDHGVACLPDFIAYGMLTGQAGRPRANPVTLRRVSRMFRAIQYIWSYERHGWWSRGW